MKQLPNPYDYSDYRIYIRDALRKAGLTYQRFCARNAKTVSFPALGQMMSNRGYRMGLEAFHRVLRALGLGRRECAHLILLRLENDVASEERNAGEVRTILREVLELNRVYGGSRDVFAVSENSLRVAETFEMLPDYLQVRVLNEIISVFNVFKARHPRRATINHALTLLGAMRDEIRRK